MKKLIIILIIIFMASCNTYNYKQLNAIEKKEVITSSIYLFVAGGVAGYMVCHELNER